MHITEWNVSQHKDKPSRTIHNGAIDIKG